MGLGLLPPAVCPEEPWAGTELGALPALWLNSLVQVQSLGTFSNGLLIHLLCNHLWAKYALFHLVTCLQTSLVWPCICLTRSNPVSPWFTWWHSQSEQLIITNKAMSFLSVLCGMCSTLPTLQAAPGFSWLHCTCDSCLSNAPPESFTCFVVNTQALRRREVVSFIYFGHDFAPSRAEFHSFCCSVILRDTSSEPAMPFHLHSCGDI